MRRILSIGEALIDFIPDQKGISLKNIENFKKAPGGAPANVACSVAKLGGNSAFIGKLGQDAFGDFLIETLNETGVDTQYIYQTDQANTALAFVSLNEDGNRDFSFYRNPSADMLLEADEIKSEWIKDDLLHFCSVDLIDAPVKKAHERIINLVLQNDGIISFDPNVRLPLWNDHDACRQTILEFIPKSHIVKISDEELEFITGIEDEDKAIDSLFIGNVKVVIYTRGSKGAIIYTKNIKVDVDGFKINAVDTTGAGDSFIGAVLFVLAVENLKLDQIDEQKAKEILLFANAVGAITASKKGAINSLPTINEVAGFIRKNIEL